MDKATEKAYVMTLEEVKSAQGNTQKFKKFKEDNSLEIEANISIIPGLLGVPTDQLVITEDLLDRLIDILSQKLKV